MQKLHSEHLELKQASLLAKNTHLLLFDSSDFVGDHGKLQWTGNWVTFLDTMLQMIVVGLSGRSLRLPTRIRSVYVDPTLHEERVQDYPDDRKGKHVSVLQCYFSLMYIYIKCNGYEIHVSSPLFFPLVVDVHVNRCLDNITAGGVQICGLHATVAPRRQQQQSPPTLEEFVFVPYLETQCLRSNVKMVEQLRHCKGKFSLTLIEYVEDKVR